MQEIAFSPLKSLDCLCRIFPVKGAIVVGAGMGDAPWFDLFVRQTVDDVLLVEADKSNVRYLEKKYSSRNQWKVLHQVVSDKEEERLFYRLSNSAESGILEPGLLRSLWPNISTREEQLCQTMTLDSLILENDVHANWLVIDCLPAISMLNGAKKNLSAFDVVVVRIVIGNDATSQLFDVRQDVDTIMRKHGLVSIGIESELHPSLGHAVYIRDIPQQTVELKRFTTELEQLREEWLEQVDAREKEKKEQQAREESNKQAERQIASQQLHIEELTQSLLVAERELLEGGQAMTDLVKIRTQLDINQKQLAVILDEFKHTREFVDKSLKNEVLNAIKQIEAYWGVEHYLETGISPTLSTERHTWPISPDFALVLIDLICTHDYDLVVEFGSGVSTVVLAKAIAKCSTSRKSRTPVQIVSFEHLEKYFDQTLKKLKNAGLEHAVQLELTPLAPYTAPDNIVYSYYNCRGVLKTLGSQFNKSRILVLVDGPPASTGKLARYPALQHMLAYFSTSRIDLLLDDYIRNDEKEIVRLWQEVLNKRRKAFSFTKYNLEKGACLIRLGN